MQTRRNILTQICISSYRIDNDELIILGALTWAGSFYTCESFSLRSELRSSKLSSRVTRYLVSGPISKMRYSLVGVGSLVGHHLVVF